MKKLLLLVFATIYCTISLSITPDEAQKKQKTQAQEWASKNFLVESDATYVENKPYLIVGVENLSTASNRTKKTQTITVWNGSLRPIFAAVYEEYEGKKPALFGTVKRLNAYETTEILRPEWTGEERRGSNNRNLYYSYTITDFDTDKYPKIFFNIGEGFTGKTNKFMIYPVDENGDIRHNSYTTKGGEYDKGIEKELREQKSAPAKLWNTIQTGLTKYYNP